MTPCIPYPMTWLPPLAAQIDAYTAQAARPRRKRRNDGGKPRHGGAPRALLSMIRRNPGASSRELREWLDIARDPWKGYSRALSQMVVKKILRTTGTRGKWQYWEAK